MELPWKDRFRVNLHQQRGAVEAAFRRVPRVIPTLDQLGLPPVVEKLIRKPNGLVLVTGPTGMGKTTTLAAMVELINHERECLVLTIEDPIEFVHTNQQAVIKQREVGMDTRSFAEALKQDARCAAAYEGLGEVLEQQGKADQARDAYTSATRLNPDDTEARRRLAELTLAAGKAAEALPHFYAYTRLQPGSGPAWLASARCAAAAGKKDEARTLLRRAIQLDPSLAEKARAEPALASPGVKRISGFARARAERTPDWAARTSPTAAAMRVFRCTASATASSAVKAGGAWASAAAGIKPISNGIARKTMCMPHSSIRALRHG
jgi:tetratricopeptide (TPR) repeat protein